MVHTAIPADDPRTQLYAKYRVVKRDGSLAEGEYFVLKPSADPAAVVALAAYADAIAHQYPDFAEVLRVAYDLPGRQRGLEAAFWRAIEPRLANHAAEARARWRYERFQSIVRCEALWLWPGQ